MTKKLQERRDEVAHSRALNLKKNYKQNELDIYVNAKRSYKKGFDACYSELMPEIQKLVDYYAFCLGAALNLYRPDNPVHKGLDPTFYHTLTYDGDIELIKKTLEAEIVLNQFKQFIGAGQGEGE